MPVMCVRVWVKEGEDRCMGTRVRMSERVNDRECIYSGKRGHN